ncbi:MAG TPA: manganese efflux pump [Streptosporangiaceae bacterium]|nr:manganese efflux pump [Streptosporangiaceae bacterium]
MVGLILVAVSVGLSNFAASLGIGVTGINARTRLQIGLVFGVFEGGMPVIGLLLGESLAQTLGDAAHWFGAALLIGAGGYGVFQAVRTPTGHAAKFVQMPAGGARSLGQTGRLLVMGVALSLDNLTVGFALGTYHVPLALAVVVFAGVSVGLSLIGLELGRRLGSRSQRRGELFGGLILVGTGAALLTHAI